jgi:hypothetical protein
MTKNQAMRHQHPRSALYPYALLKGNRKKRAQIETVQVSGLSQSKATWEISSILRNGEWPLPLPEATTILTPNIIY